MVSKLDDDLAQIDSYLKEIRSHILEKAEAEFVESSEEALSKVITGYGSAKAVAERYS